MASPWGKIQNVVTICRGVRQVSTASHGGLMVALGFAKENLSEAARKRGMKYGGYLAYEEDCKYAIPLFELYKRDLSLVPKHIPQNEILKELKNIISRWNADYLIEMKIEPSEKEYAQYLITKQYNEMREEKHPDLIISAKSLDNGKVEVITADSVNHIVDLERYKSMTGLYLLSKCS